MSDSFHHKVQNFLTSRRIFIGKPPAFHKNNNLSSKQIIEAFFLKEA